MRLDFLWACTLFSEMKTASLERQGNPTPANHIWMKSQKQSSHKLNFEKFTKFNLNRLQIFQWSNETIRRVVRKNWSIRGGSITKYVDMMVTPRVVEEVREHFNCSILEGAELEDQGGEGTALTHWEKRILEVISGACKALKVIVIFLPRVRDDILCRTKLWLAPTHKIQYFLGLH